MHISIIKHFKDTPLKFPKKYQNIDNSLVKCRATVETQVETKGWRKGEGETLRAKGEGAGSIALRDKGQSKIKKKSIFIVFSENTRFKKYSLKIR